MSHWISSIIKHCCLLHSKGRLPAPISPSEILLLPSNNLFHPKVVKKMLKQWLVYVHSTQDILLRVFFVLLQTAQAHTLWSNVFFSNGIPNMLMYIMCVHHHQFWCGPRFTAAWCLLLPFHFRCYWCDIIYIPETTRNNLLLSAYMGLWCWSQSFTLNLLGDTWCKEEDRVFWLSQLYDLSSSAASCVSCSTLQNPDTGILTLLCASDSSDRPATKIDVAQIENRGRMAIMSG